MLYWLGYHQVVTDLSSTVVDTCTGEMSLSIPIFLVLESEFHHTVGEEDELEEDDEQ